MNGNKEAGFTQAGLEIAATNHIAQPVKVSLPEIVNDDFCRVYDVLFIDCVVRQLVQFAAIIRHRADAVVGNINHPFAIVSQCTDCEFDTSERFPEHPQDACNVVI